MGRVADMSANLLPADPVRGASGADLAYCRGVLPRVSRTFAANIGVLRGPLADQVTVAYLLCRTADALEDSWPGPPAELAERFERLRDALAGERVAAQSLARDAAALGPGRPDLELAARLPVVLRVLDSFPDDVRHLIVEAVCTMARGMQRYAVRAAERAARAAATPHLDTQAETMLRQHQAVEKLHLLKTPYQLVSRALQPEDTSVTIGADRNRTRWTRVSRAGTATA